MTILIVALFSFVLGFFVFPLALFLRARRDSEWDDSNMLNIYRLVAHIATHPGDFGKVQYPNGKRPFWYISKDEITDVVDSRP